MKSRIMLNGSLAKEVRLACGLTQKEFASALRIPQPFLSQIERGKKPAPELFLARLKRQFNVSDDFLTSKPSPYKSGELNFRTKQIPVAVQEAVRVTFSWTEREVRDSLGDRPYTRLEIEDLGDREVPLPIEVIEEAAHNTRRALGLSPTGPVVNVTRALERHGIPVALLRNPAVDTSAVDGVSSPHPDGRPVIAVTEQQAGDRARFTRAHELGHIVLHQAFRPGMEPVREKEAHMFAGAFLMPSEDARKELTPSLTPAGFAQVKARYGVSISALIRRAFDLDIIDSKRYRSLMIQISSRGWRTNEPVEVPVETIKLYPHVNLDLMPFAQPAHQEEEETFFAGEVVDMFNHG